MNSELYIEGERADLSKDMSSLITYSIDDVKDFSARSTSYSKTIVLPGTQKNNKIFGHLFNIASSNEYNASGSNIGYNFNPSLSAKCILFQDNIQVMSGGLRVLEIIQIGDVIEYECAIHGNLSSLSYALAGKLIQDLDFSEYDHTYSLSNILTSWDSAAGKGYTYPLIDYGSYSINKKDWDVRTLRPAFYLKEYLSKMFKAAGFSFNSKFFDTNFFKALIVPHNRKRLDRLGSGLLSAKDDPINRGRFIFKQVIFPPTLVSGWKFDVEDTTIFDKILTTAAGSILPFNTFKYLGDATKVNATYSMPLTITNAFRRALKVSLVKNNVEIPESVYLFPRQPFFGFEGDPVLNLDGDQTIDYITAKKTFSFDLQTNDLIYFAFTTYTDAAGTSRPDQEFSAETNGGTFTLASAKAVFVPLTLGDKVVANDTIARNYKQIDFLLSVVKLFNLYITENNIDNKILNIEPFVDFYSTNSASAINWTYKVARNLPIRITPMSELNSKVYDFNYADDGDFYNDLYKKRYNKGYGNYSYNSQFEFATNTDKAELIFASTPLVGYDGEAKVYPTIFKKNNNIEEVTDSIIRLMLSKKISNVPLWDIKDGATVLVVTDNYMYAGHLDDPDNPDVNLNYGVSEEFFFTLVTGDVTKTMFNIFWSGYMAEITDKDSKLVKLKAHLKTNDIGNLDFSKYIYIDGVLFRLNKIVDYNASNPDLCTIELLKVINTTYTSSSPNPNESYFLIDNDNGYLLDIDNGKIFHENG
jgi:hypothetical protein